MLRTRIAVIATALGVVLGLGAAATPAAAGADLPVGKPAAVGGWTVTVVDSAYRQHPDSPVFIPAGQLLSGPPPPYLKGKSLLFVAIRIAGPAGQSWNVLGFDLVLKSGKTFGLNPQSTRVSDRASEYEGTLGFLFPDTIAISSVKGLAVEVPGQSSVVMTLRPNAP